MRCRDRFPSVVCRTSSPRQRGHRIAKDRGEIAAGLDLLAYGWMREALNGPRADFVLPTSLWYVQLSVLCSVASVVALWSVIAASVSSGLAFETVQGLISSGSVRRVDCFGDAATAFQ